MNFSQSSDEDEVAGTAEMTEDDLHPYILPFLLSKGVTLTRVMGGARAYPSCHGKKRGNLGQVCHTAIHQ